MKNLTKIDMGLGTLILIIISPIILLQLICQEINEFGFKLANFMMKDYITEHTKDNKIIL